MNNWSGARQHGRRPICLTGARLCSTTSHRRSTCASAMRVCRACNPSQPLGRRIKTQSTCGRAWTWNGW